MRRIFRTLCDADVAVRARILCVAGEASGDALLAAVAQETRGIALRGIGGDAAASAGVELLAHARDLAASGLVEALGSVPAWLRAASKLRGEVAHADALLLIDFPELNMRALGWANRARVPVAYLAPPQAWAWRPWRGTKLRSAAWVGCLLPFEAAWYRRQGVRADWVGHPLAEVEPPPPPPPTCDDLALLPGSRDATVRRVLPVMLGAAAILARRNRSMRFHLPLASTVDRGFVQRAVRVSDLPVQLWANSSDAIAASRIGVASAGTATLELALAGRPVITVARVAKSTAWVASRLVLAPHLGLPNLILGRRAFPELVQEACTPERVAVAAEELLAGRSPERVADLLELRARLCSDGRFADRVAAVLCDLATARLDAAAHIV